MKILFFRFIISFEGTVATLNSLVTTVNLTRATNPISRFLGPTTAADADAILIRNEFLFLLLLFLLSIYFLSTFT